MGVIAAPLAEVQRDGDRVGFTIPDVPGAPAFSGTLRIDALVGDFTQAGQSFPVTLTRGALAGAARPQEPHPPFPYRTEDVTYHDGEVQLAGTLTLPAGPGPFTAVLLVSGSGPQDRDEALLGHKPFLVLSDTLTRAGYAVLRVDDRGVGGSTGDLNGSDYEDLTGTSPRVSTFFEPGRTSPGLVCSGTARAVTSRRWPRNAMVMLRSWC